MSNVQSYINKINTIDTGKETLYIFIYGGKTVENDSSEQMKILYTDITCEVKQDSVALASVNICAWYTGSDG